MGMKDLDLEGYYAMGCPFLDKLEMDDLIQLRVSILSAENYSPLNESLREAVEDEMMARGWEYR